MGDRSVGIARLQLHAGDARQKMLFALGTKLNNQLVGQEPTDQLLGILEIVLTPMWSTVGKCLRQVQTHGAPISHTDRSEASFPTYI